MAVYKVPQDVEAEDKLIGPFTFRQFIFLIIAAVSLFLTYQFSTITPFLSLVPLPFAVVFGILGLYRRQDQPVEIYLMALLRFYLKPHKRIWDQEGVIESVKITAPKKPTHQYTDNMSQSEVKGRLDTLAKMMDSRGWSVKNVDLTSPTPVSVDASDRLVVPTSAPQPSEIHASDDILDVVNNPVARDFQAKMQATTVHAKEEAVAHMQQATQAQTQAQTQTSTQDQSDNNQAQIDETQDEVSFSPYPTSMHQSVISPVSSQAAAQPAPSAQPEKPVQDQSSSTMTEAPSDAILNLANNSDLRISTIASEAARIESMEDDQTINLH